MKGIHPQAGITEADRDLAQAMKAIMDASNEVISLSTLDSLNTSLPFKIDDIDKISILITELDSENELLNYGFDIVVDCILFIVRLIQLFIVQFITPTLFTTGINHKFYIR